MKKRTYFAALLPFLILAGMFEILPVFTIIVIGLAVAFVGGRAACEKGGRPKRIFMSVLNMVSNFSGVPLAFSFIILLGNAGVITILGRNLGIDAIADFPSILCGMSGRRRSA